MFACVFEVIVITAFVCSCSAFVHYRECIWCVMSQIVRHVTRCNCVDRTSLYWLRRCFRENVLSYRRIVYLVTSLTVMQPMIKQF